MKRKKVSILIFLLYTFIALSFVYGEDWGWTAVYMKQPIRKALPHSPWNSSLLKVCGSPKKLCPQMRRWISFHKYWSGEISDWGIPGYYDPLSKYDGDKSKYKKGYCLKRKDWPHSQFPRILKGGIVLIDIETSAIQRIIMLQYNPDTLTRIFRLRVSAGERKPPMGQGDHKEKSVRGRVW